LLDNQAKKKCISIITNIGDRCFAYADKNMVDTILRNLLTNAIKFTPENGNIVVSTFNHHDHVEIAVRDTGVGIGKEDMEYIFRIDRKTTTLGTDKEKGSGLGLILCKEFIEKHGGKIWAESELGRGSTFKFTIPLSN
jgi:signal transduction histidine kinase